MKGNLAAHLEQTLLKVETTMPMVEALCRQSAEAGMAGVCIPPYYVAVAHRILAATQTKTVTVVGFPYGYDHTSAKAEATRKALQDGADEVDMVMNIGAFMNGNYLLVGEEIGSLLTLCHMNGKALKVIIETGLLSDDQIKKACEICAAREVDFVKTSTGINGPGASVEAVALLRSCLPASVRIKASGGIRDRQFALALIGAGADRIGTSAGFQISEIQ
ncbi:MAG: deoxyribose-phosphate aldolase [Bacteroidetes bacterium]|nr:deoxyribose-phosphate aldolase [Bacteroidota bacterium]